MRMRPLSVACVALLILFSWVGSAAGTNVTVASVTGWKTGAAPMAWAGGRVFFNRRACVTCPFKAYSSLPDGSSENALGGAYPPTTNDGVSDVSPDGRYALMVVERSGHWPVTDGDYSAAPGVGTYNDLWLQDVATGRSWKLVDLLKTGSNALIWPRFSPDGTRIVWTEQWQAGWLDLGKWTLRVADLTWKAGTPTLVNVSTRKTTGFVEAYGFVGGDVLAAVDTLVGNSWSNAQIARVPVDPTRPAVRLSPEVPWEDWGMFVNYNEFAYVMPSSPDRIMFGRTYGATGGSIEFWTMGLDGSIPERLTYASVPSSPQYLAAAVMFGGVAFDPDNPGRFVAGYGTNYAGGYGSAMIDTT